MSGETTQDSSPKCYEWVQVDGFVLTCTRKQGHLMHGATGGHIGYSPGYVQYVWWNDGFGQWEDDLRAAHWD